MYFTTFKTLCCDPKSAGSQRLWFNTQLSVKWRILSNKYDEALVWPFFVFRPCSGNHSFLFLTKRLQLPWFVCMELTVSFSFNHIWCHVFCGEQWVIKAVSDTGQPGSFVPAAWLKGLLGLINEGAHHSLQRLYFISHRVCYARYTKITLCQLEPKLDRSNFTGLGDFKKKAGTDSGTALTGSGSDVTATLPLLTRAVWDTWPPEESAGCDRWPGAPELGLMVQRDTPREGGRREGAGPIEALMKLLLLLLMMIR